MFERERKYKSHLTSHRERLRQLEALNAHLQEQLHLLITSILGEIERIQNLIEEQQDQEQSLGRHIFAPTPKHSEAASETESTIHKDLEELKAKVKEIYNQKYTTTHETEPAAYHRSDYKSDASSRFAENHQEAFLNAEIESGERPERRQSEAEVGRPKIERGRRSKPL